jgi:integrase/recombinase XerD
MFEILFTHPKVLRRHRDGPLAAERTAYLEGLAAQGLIRSTLLRRAAYCLCVARQVDRWPTGYCFDSKQIGVMACEWAARRKRRGCALSRRPKENFQFVATDFLRAIGRLRPPPAAAPKPYDAELADFLTAQEQSRWQSEQTVRSARWQIRQFLDHLVQRDIRLQDITIEDIDGYFEDKAQCWRRSSLRTCGNWLRAWLTHCESKGWVRQGLANAVLLPRIYQHENVPLGPTWEEVSCMLAEAAGDEPVQLRDYAILLLLSVYGVRSSEVRRLRLDDIDWSHARIRIVRAKNGREETLPLEVSVGNAIARYLRDGRPKSNSRTIFLRVHAPHRPLSSAGIYNIVAHHLTRVSSPKRGRGPHALRHACARHLVEAGRSYKEIGDYLGHSSPDATRIYAKIDIASLRRVAFEDLGRLV